MRYIFLLTCFYIFSFAEILNINSFEADFTQTVINSEASKLYYTGHIKAEKPLYALWDYSTPSSKFIYILDNKVTIIEPDLEQVIIKNIGTTIDFFTILKHAKKIAIDTYIANFQSTKYTIKIKNKNLVSISYKDELENSINIIFTHQKYNVIMQRKEFVPVIPKEFDIIQG